MYIILSSTYLDLLWFTHDLNFVSPSKSQCPWDHVVAWGTYYGAPWSIMPDMYTAAPWCQRIGEPSNKLCSSKGRGFRLHCLKFQIIYLDTVVYIIQKCPASCHFQFFFNRKKGHPPSGSNHSNYCTIAVGRSNVTGSKCIEPFRWSPDRLWGNPW